MASLRVLGLVPARGGSKGVPGKNIRRLGSKPLLQYTAEAASQAKRLTQVILSTDDEEIASVGRRCGLNVPFLRPAELAADATPTLPVIQHAIRTMEEQGQHFDAVCLLQPTTPFREPGEIDGCIELLETRSVESVFTIQAVPAEYNPHWVYFENDKGLLRLSTGESTPIPRRQALPPAYHRDGSVYVTRRNTVMVKSSLYGDSVAGYKVQRTRRVNIDTEADWQSAERLLEQKAA